MGRISFFASLFIIFQINACTDFLLEDVHKNVVVGRSMEFGVDLQSKIAIHPRREKDESCIGNDIGLSWISDYAYIGVDTLGINLLVDGMNEKGLSMGALWFPGAEYPKFRWKTGGKIVAFEDLGRWMLGTCCYLEQVKEAMESVDIWVHNLPVIDEIPPIHLSFHDRSGKSLVIEFLDAEMKIEENPIGVLTNAPKFEWQMTNVSNYINLTALDQGDTKLDGTVLDPTGHGTGMLGLPGDWTPQSRFVRIALLKNYVVKTRNAKENANLVFHLLNTVDIPYGAIQSVSGKNFDYTQWAVVKDLCNEKFYYRTYGDLDYKMIDFSCEKVRTGDKVRTLPMGGASN